MTSHRIAEHVERRLVAGGDRKIGAAEHTEFDPTVHDESERDRVLPLSEEAFRPIDRVERPKAGRVVLGVAAIDPLKEIVGCRTDAEPLDLTKDAAQETRVFRLTECGRVLFSDDRIVGKGVANHATNQRLTAEIGDRHRAVVLLVEDIRGDRALYGSTQM